MPDLLFPVNDSDDFVSMSQLPADANEALELLRMELVPLKLWRALAVEYMRRGDFGNAEIILRAGCDREVQSVPVYAAETTDQVALFNSLASLVTMQAVFSQGNFNEAKELHERAGVLEVVNQYTWVGKGNSLLAAYVCQPTGPDTLIQAIKQFQLAIDDPSGVCSHIARLGKAHALLLQNHYKQALEEYRSVLRVFGSDAVPNLVRVCIGICHYRLGRVSKAGEVFKRALEVDKHCVEALVGLASCSQLDITTIFESLPDMDLSNPSLVAILAHHLLFNGDALKAEMLCRKILSQTIGSGEIKAFISLILAASLHAQKRFDEAYKVYSQVASDITTVLTETGKKQGQSTGVIAKSVSLNPLLIASKIGCAQCGLTLGKESEAMNAVGIGSADGNPTPRYPESIDSLRVWSYLQSRGISQNLNRKFHKGKAAANGIGTTVAAIETALEKCLKERPSDVALLRLRADLLLNTCSSVSDSQIALEAIKACPDEDARCLFNEASLLIDTGDFVEAQHILEKIQDESLSDIVQFMRAYIAESSSSSDALPLYEALISSSHGVVSACAKIRAALIHEKNGSIAEIPSLLSLELNPEDNKPTQTEANDLLTIGLAQFYARQGSLEQAINVLVTSSSLKHDHYKNVVLGDLFLRNSFAVTPDSREEESLLTNALKYYSRALESSSASFYAVCGVANILAMKSRKQQALELFKNLADSRNSRPMDDAVIQIGLGHLAYDGPPQDAMVNAKRATKCYEAALRLLAGSEDTTLVNSVRLYLASAYFASNRHEDCCALLVQIPMNGDEPLYYRFNLAVVYEHVAFGIMGDKAKVQSLEWILKAIGVFQKALSIFENLMALHQSGGIPEKDFMTRLVTETDSQLEKHLNYCRDTLIKFEASYQERAEAIAKEQERRDQVESMRMQREEAENQRRMELIEQERVESEELQRQADMKMADLKESLAAAMKGLDDDKRGSDVDDGGPDAQMADGEFKAQSKKKRGKKTSGAPKRKTKKRNVKDEDSSSSSSSSSSGSSSSDEDSSSGSSSSDSDSSSSSSSGSSSSSSSGAKRKSPSPQTSEAIKDVIMEELFGDSEL